MITLIVDNKHVVIENAPLRIIRALQLSTSYLVAGYYWAPSFRSHHWDGREHLLKFSIDYGYRVPTGLLATVYATIREYSVKIKIIDKRRQPKKLIEFRWNKKIKLRPHQAEAVKAITRGALPGRGILKMPIRSGKTFTMARIIYKLKAKTLFVVPSQLLLYQTRDALDDVLMRGGEIGVVGDSRWQECDITVATIQTLNIARKGGDPRYKKMLKKYDLVVFDECHHLTGDEWHDVILGFDSLYKIGLSATVFLTSTKEMERGVIWLQGCCGDVQYEVDMSRLIKEGWLMKPYIRLYPVNKPNLHEQKWSQSLLNEAIYENKTRNNLIVKLACEYVGKGMSVLIVSNRINQTESLLMKLDDTPVTVETITGRVGVKRRRDIIENFITGRTQVLVGTVFGEGIDIPEVECVINAEGGTDVKATTQRMRNLTPFKGKKKAVFIDFVDVMNKYFTKHSMSRVKVYRSEPEFNIKLIKS
jgi:superfamily II DNA or RNA helicase